MDIVNISQSDDLASVARKCDTNFKQVSWALRQYVNKQGRIAGDQVNRAITVIRDDVDNLVAGLPGMVSDEVTTQLNALDIQQMVADMVAEQLDEALNVTYTSTASDVIVEDGCTITALDAVRWGSVVSIRFSYRLSSALTVPSNGDITDVTLGRLKDGWRPANMTNAILDQTKIIVGDIDSSGYVKARSANSRGTSYIIDANTVLYASMTFVTGIQ